jgi:uncharacterized protein YecE (DUF72 family)
MITVGTAGWSLPKPVQDQFPGEGTHLSRYSRRLRGVEINSSFYRSHASQTYARWAAATPPGFRFAVKVPRIITHEGRLRRAREPLDRFLGEIAGLEKRLGPLLVQLPPSFEYEPRVVRAFLALLRDRHDGPVVWEPRHPSWFGARPDALLLGFRIARVAADPAVVAAAAVPGGWPKTAYFRLHGSPSKYWSTYPPEALAQWAKSIRKLPRGTDAWCVFDNTAGGGAAANALEMAALMKARRTGKSELIRAN